MHTIYKTEWDREDEDSRYIEDERINLSVTADSTILAIADLGRWDGRRKGYKVLGHALNSIFNCWDSCEDITLEVDGHNVIGTGHHHDGTNYVKFRKFKFGITDDARDRVTEAIYNGSPEADKLIARYTRSIRPDVAKVYGW